MSINGTQIGDSGSIPEVVRKECEQLILSEGQIKEIGRRFLEQVNKGLRKDTHAESEIKCFVTYVQDLPNGQEQGRFLALDLGGTNFRVLLIELKGEDHFEMESKIYAVPQKIMTGPGSELFDHIAECLANFMKEHNVYDEHLPLGFTFSFPCKQLGLTKGILVSWTKGFNCPGVEGKDVVQLLKEAIDRRGDIEISVMAILNDSTGTLMSCAHRNHNCKIGVIIGTGCNACYVERVENAELFDGPRDKPHVLINSEFGAFGDSGSLDFIRTEYDRDVDKHSMNPGRQLHEKMISGMYMGEMVRLVLQKFIRSGLLFGGKGSERLFTRGEFYTKYVSEIESDKPGEYDVCREVLDELGISNAADQDCAVVRFVCECISKRAADLVSCALAMLVNKMNEPSVTIGVDGSVYRFHPKFAENMKRKIRELTHPHIEFELMLSEDGSGRGAALVAAVACREN